MLVLSEAWKAAYPGAAAGLLVMDTVSNPSTHPELERRKDELTAHLRERYGRLTRADIVALPTVQPYVDYYKRFKKTYHVQLQLESVALKGKALPRVAALVEAMFMAELENQLLTAGHDAAIVEPPIQVDVSKDGEGFVAFSGQTQTLQPNDMVMRDGGGVISSVLYGPDHRTRVRPETRRAAFAVYAPAGIGPERVTAHLHTIAANVRIVAPDATIVSLEVGSA